LSNHLPICSVRRKYSRMAVRGDGASLSIPLERTSCLPSDQPTAPRLNASATSGADFFQGRPSRHCHCNETETKRGRDLPRRSLRIDRRRVPDRNARRPERSPTGRFRHAPESDYTDSQVPRLRCHSCHHQNDDGVLNAKLSRCQDHPQGTSTAAPSNRPARRSARASLALISG
jgi:hypothetical protein